MTALSHRHKNQARPSADEAMHTRMVEKTAAQAMTARNNAIADAKTIHGWGVDYDPQNNPAFPMKQGSPGRDNAMGNKWHRPTLQNNPYDVLQSNEHIRRPATYGTAAPLKGLSGVIRRFAFRYTESNLMHWLPLILADRVDMIEGIFQDLFSGRIPNIPQEMGFKSEWKYNKAGLARKALIGTAVIIGIAALLGKLND